MKKWLVAAVVLACSASASAQKAYRWVDAEGRVIYSDRPPPPGAAKAENRKLKGSIVETSLPPYAVQQAMRDYPVTLYSADKCEACDAARSLLTKRGVPFNEIAVGDAASIEELKRVSGGDRVPVMKVGTNVLKSYEPGQYNAALDLAGYPQSVPAYAKVRKPEAPGAEGAAADNGGASAQSR